MFTLLVERKNPQELTMLMGKKELEEQFLFSTYILLTYEDIYFYQIKPTLISIMEDL